MAPPVVTRDPTSVEVEVQAAYLAMFPHGDRLFVPQVFGWAIDCFTGSYRDYQAVDARYHDFEHTLQGTLCMARLLQGRYEAKAQPELTQRIVQLGLLAILLHDTGYLKKRNDSEGTGAKYTVTHVERSAEFAAQLLTDKGFGPGEIKSVQNMIHCTGVDANLIAIPFQGEMEKTILYSEFAEAVRYTKDRSHFIAAFSSAADLMQRTPMFWDKYVQRKMDRDFGSLYRYLNDPYPSGPNSYLERIEANMARLRERISSSKAQTV